MLWMKLLPFFETPVDDHIYKYISLKDLHTSIYLEKRCVDEMFPQKNVNWQNFHVAKTYRTYGQARIWY